MKRIVFFLAAAAVMTLSPCGPKPAKPAGINYAYMDTATRPGGGLYAAPENRVNVW